MTSPTPLDHARRLGTRIMRKAVRTVAGHGSPIRRHMPDPLVRRFVLLRPYLPRVLVRTIEAAGRVPVDPVLFEEGSRRPSVPDTPVRVWIAPANFAGQGRAWAHALERHVGDVGARNMAVTGVIRFPADQEVAPEIYRDVQWQIAQEQYVHRYTHVLVEAERPVFGTRYGRTCQLEIDRLRDAGLTVGLISHGSDLRIPSEHVKTHRYSPFTDPDDRTTQILEARANRNGRIVAEFDGPVFVSTPDLIDYAPNATWCPTVVDFDYWAPEWPLLERERPRVVHIPSNGPLKGTAFIDEAMQRLHDAGRIEYRSLRKLTHEEVQAEYEGADIVIDQLVLGLYGVAAIEAMAAGRVVVAFLGDAVRRRIREATGLEVPILEADPDTIQEVVEGILDDRDAARRVAAQGPPYARRVHDGRFSAQVLTEFTGGELRAEARPADDVADDHGAPDEGAGAGSGSREHPRLPRPVPDPAADVRLFVGPVNFAGQGRAWARAAQADLPGVSARSMATTSPSFVFPADMVVDSARLGEKAWCQQQERYLVEYYTHVLAESMRPLTGHRYGRGGNGEIDHLRSAGLDVALIAHGTDIRVPSLHREQTPWSPFVDEDWPGFDIIEARASRQLAAMLEFDGPRFVSTPDLLDLLPQALWCPVVVDPARWTRRSELLADDEPPTVVHVPSHTRMKGSDRLEPAMRRLDDEGVIRYRSLRRVPPEQMPEVIATADVVLDQFVLGSYGVAACEAMSAGCVVLGHVTDAVRNRVTQTTGAELPIVETTLGDVEDVVRSVATERGRYRELAARGPQFVADVHDGRRSAAALATWLRP